MRLLGETFGEADWRALRTRLGFVSASIAQLLHDEDTALEIVAGGRQAMMGYWGAIPAADRSAARRLLASLKAAPLAEKPWQVLSQGERQRVLIARALMARPRVLLLDEPCAGLDPVARERFLAFLEDFGSRKSTMPLVLVTHHVEEILPVFTHALVLRNGRALCVGSDSRRDHRADPARGVRRSAAPKPAAGALPVAGRMTGIASHMSCQPGTFHSFGKPLH